MTASRVVLDKDRLVADAGLDLSIILAEKLGMQAAANQLVHLSVGAPFLRGRKVLTLINRMLAAGDSIEDCDVLRSGASELVAAGEAMTRRVGCAP